MKRELISVVILAFVSPFAHAEYINPHAAEEIGTVREIYDGTLFPGRQVSTFRNIDRLFATRTVSRGDYVHPLTKGRELENFQFTSNGKNYDLFDYVSLNRVTGLLILKDGKIALERYELGNNENTRWMSMSIIKSFTGILVGAAVRDGFIKNIDDPLTTYLPQFAGSSYERVTIRNLIQMASGVQWDETYTNPASDRRKMLELQLDQKPGAILEYMTKLPRAAEAGTHWKYSTGETQVVAALVRAAVGKPLAQYLSEKIWAKFGMESDASWWLDSPNGLEFGGAGLSATLRDYGRMGLFLLGGGAVRGEHILPDGWIAEASSPKVVGGKSVDYGYMLWPIPNAAGTANEGAFTGTGIFGQRLYVNPRANVVIVVWGALPKPTGKEPIVQNDFFAAAINALQSQAASK